MIPENASVKNYIKCLSQRVLQKSNVKMHSARMQGMNADKEHANSPKADGRGENAVDPLLNHFSVVIQETPLLKNG